MGQVFISYAHDDAAIAQELYHKLEKRGGMPWLDRFHLIGGVTWREATQKAIDDSMHIIVLLSEHSLIRDKRREVQNEIQQALRIRRRKYPNKTFVIPVRIDKVEVGGFVHWQRRLSDLKEIHWIEWAHQDAMDQIWRALTDEDHHP